MSDNQTISVYDENVQNYSGMVTNTKPDKHLVRFMEAIPKGSKVLDLGCGPAQASAHMRNYGIEVDPVDASVEMVNFANKTYDIGARVGFFDDLNEIETYDGVWANFSLLHAPRDNVPGHLRQISTSLKASGIFSIGMKTGSGEKRDDLGRRYAYFEANELCQMLEEAGFEILETSQGEDKGLSGSVDPWIVVLTRKK